jgi:ribosomal protein L29
MEHSKTHYLGKSRQVLEINDPAKLQKLLEEQRGELMKVSVGFGSKRMSFTGATTQPIKNKHAIRNIKRNIARIMTRQNQLKQIEIKSKN